MTEFKHQRTLNPMPSQDDEIDFISWLINGNYPFAIDDTTAKFCSIDGERKVYTISELQDIYNAQKNG